MSSLLISCKRWNFATRHDDDLCHCTNYHYSAMNAHMLPWISWSNTVRSAQTFAIIQTNMIKMKKDINAELCHQRITEMIAEAFCCPPWPGLASHYKQIFMTNSAWNDRRKRSFPSEWVVRSISWFTVSSLHGCSVLVGKSMFVFISMFKIFHLTGTLLIWYWIEAI